MGDNKKDKNKGNDNPDDWDNLERNFEDKGSHPGMDSQDAEVMKDDDELNPFDDIDDVESFNEVLALTPYETRDRNTSLVVAEFSKIEVGKIEERYTKQAKSIVSKIVTFILSMKGGELSKPQETYIRQIGALQMRHLSDLLQLEEMNKMVLNNILERINATMGEDYAIIQTYNNLVSQHFKLVRELKETYRNIPSTLKKMKTDILCDQELNGNGGELPDTSEITGDTGGTYRSGKEFLKTILEKRAAEKAARGKNDSV
jgi:hypothetical protein